MKKLVSSLISGLLVFSGVSLAPIARAAETEPRVFLSDYTPNAGDQVRLYFEGLEPYTEYSYGYIFAIEDVVQASYPDYLDAIGELGSFMADRNGKHEIEFYWHWNSSPTLDVFPGLFPSHIYVNTLGALPEKPSDALGYSKLVLPGHLFGLGDVVPEGPALAGDFIQSDSTLAFDISEINSDFDMYEIYGWVGDGGYYEIWEAAYGTTWSVPYQISYGELNPGQELLVIETPPYDMTKVMVFFYSSIIASSGWMIIDGSGNEVWVDDNHDYADIPTQVRPYTWTEGYYGSEDSTFRIAVSTPKKCFANGNDLIFMSPGKCSWKIFDAQSNYVFSDSATITASAPEDASFPLEVLHLKFAKGKSALTSKMMSRIEDFAYFLDFLDFYVAGHSYDEGTKKSMTALAKARTIAVKNYLRIGAEKVIANTSMGNASPFGNATNSRRVDVISLPVDDWIDFW